MESISTSVSVSVSEKMDAKLETRNPKLSFGYSRKFL
jgi:hypothetical protein